MTSNCFINSLPTSWALGDKELNGFLASEILNFFFDSANSSSGTSSSAGVSAADGSLGSVSSGVEANSSVGPSACGGVPNVNKSAIDKVAISNSLILAK